MDEGRKEPASKRARVGGDSQKIGFGLVGCGMGAETHAWAFKHMEDVEFAAVYGRDECKAMSFATKWGAAKAYSDYRAFLEDTAVEVVIIVVPNGLHADFAVPAAKAGKHLVVEKPLDTTLEKGLAIARACKEAGVVLTGIYQMRFCEATERIERAIAANKLGTLLHCDVVDKEYRCGQAYYGKDGDHWWAGQADLAGGGCLTTQSSHVLDLMTTFMGPVDRVFAKSRTAFHDIQVEDIVSAVITFTSGATATVNSSTCIKPAFKHRIEVHGTKGTVIMNGEYDKIMFWDLEDDEEKINEFGSVGITDIVDPHNFPMDRHIANLRDMMSAVRSGGTIKPKLDAEEFLRSELVRFALYDSAKQGKEVHIDYSKVEL